MKQLGKVTDPKDCTTKEYVDKLTNNLDTNKLNTKDLSELTEDEVQELWNNIFVKTT